VTFVLAGALALITTLIFFYLFVVRTRRFERHGSVEVPGDEVLELPEGEVAIYYQDAFKWRHSERPRVWEGFSLLVSDETSGERLDVRPPGNETVYKSAGRNRIPYGLLQVPRAGPYRVVSRIGPDAAGPRVTFG
jgi:hypothetical protein